MSSETTESASFYDFLAWLETNKKRVIAAAVIVVVVAFIIAFAVWRKNQTEADANEALLKLGLPIQQSENAPTVNPSDLLKIADQYPSTSAGQRALLLAAGAYFNTDKYNEALDQFKKYVAQNGNSPEAPIASLGTAACLEALNKPDEALAAYQRVVSAYPNEPVASQARLAIGRLYEAKKQPELALRSYDEVLHQGARSEWQAQANELREQLLVRYPQLAPSNAPVVTSFTNAATTNVPKASTAGTTNPATRSNAPSLTVTNRPAPKSGTNR